jgi:hypothetical protein
MAADGVQVLGSYINPISGTRVEIFQAYSTNALGHNQTVTYASVTDKFGKEIAPQITHDSASSNGWLGAGFAGFIGNLPNAGGLIGGAALLRPSSTNVNQSGGGVGSNTGSGSGGLNVSSSASASAKAKTSQSQYQGQAQSQGQSIKNTGKGNSWIPPGHRD